MRPVPLPSLRGKILGSTFSPDSTLLAAVTYVPSTANGISHHFLELIQLASNTNIGEAEILQSEPADIAGNRHFIEYSNDGRYLLSNSGFQVGHG
jgi:hypothetical protein